MNIKKAVRGPQFVSMIVKPKYPGSSKKRIILTFDSGVNNTASHPVMFTPFTLCNFKTSKTNSESKS